MTQHCKNCRKFMKNSEMTHCSDECLLVSMKTSTSLNDTGINAISWDEKSNPWK